MSVATRSVVGKRRCTRCRGRRVRLRVASRDLCHAMSESRRACHFARGRTAAFTGPTPNPELHACSYPHCGQLLWTKALVESRFVTTRSPRGNSGLQSWTTSPLRPANRPGRASDSSQEAARRLWISSTGCSRRSSPTPLEATAGRVSLRYGSSQQARRRRHQAPIQPRS
jgi:hypothetical protein